MHLRIGLLHLLLCCWTTGVAAELRVTECRGEHGERVFGDSANCAGAIVREWTLSRPPAAPASAAATANNTPATGGRQRRSKGRASANPPQLSFLCSAGALTWYQHSPCRSSAAKGESVRQTRVTRQQACREVTRPASALRPGSERDERAGPYARATGRDPCR